jgi:uncharacterized membrane protein YfcA
VVATKAVTQTLGHVLKLIYYGLIIGLTEPIALWFLGVAVATAVLGTRVGTLILMRFDETRFRQLSGWVILAIGALCIVKGARDLWGVA